MSAIYIDYDQYCKTTGFSTRPLGQSRTVQTLNWMGNIEALARRETEDEWGYCIFCSRRRSHNFGITFTLSLGSDVGT